jgi:hypothetical protein
MFGFFKVLRVPVLLWHRAVLCVFTAIRGGGQAASIYSVEA